jgi:lysozyme
MSKYKPYKKTNSPLYYQTGGFNMDFFKNVAGNWKKFMQNPDSVDSDKYLNDLSTNSTNIRNKRENLQGQLILPNREFDGWGDTADAAYTEKIWEQNGYAQKYGDWKSLTEDQRYDAWKKHKYSRPGWFNDTKLGSDLHQSGAMYDKDVATRKELSGVNKEFNDNLINIGGGIASIYSAQKEYDKKPQEKFSLDFTNNKGIMRSQTGGGTGSQIMRYTVSSENPQKTVSSFEGPLANKIRFDGKGSPLKSEFEVVIASNDVMEALVGLQGLSKTALKKLSKNYLVDLLKVNSKHLISTGIGQGVQEGASYQTGGGIPTSPLGLYQYPGQMVNVPSGRITMRDINYPVLALPNNNKPEVMYPGKEYEFEDSDSVLEVPMMKYGGGDYPYTDYDDLDDEDVKDQIKKHEGSVVDKYGKHISYADSRGFNTIGYGHLWKPGDPTVLTQKQADELFNKDYRIHKKHAENIPGYHKANSNQKKALINLTFNMGANWYKKFPKFTKAFLEGDSIGAAEQLRKSKWAKQVGKRSDDVINTFLADSEPQPVRDNITQVYPTSRAEEDVPQVETRDTRPVTERAFDFLATLKQQHKTFYDGSDFSSIYNNSENI